MYRKTDGSNYIFNKDSAVCAYKIYRSAVTAGCIDDYPVQT